MANIHGKNAVIYLGSNGGEAVNVTEMADWSIDMDISTAETSQLNLSWKEFVKGMQGWSATISGNFNTTSKQIWDASVNNFAEKFYIYPTIASPTQYYCGTGWVMLTKIAAGSISTKASSAFKVQGTKDLFCFG